MPPVHRFFSSYDDGVIYVVDPVRRSARKVHLEGFIATTAGIYYNVKTTQINLDIYVLDG